MIAFGQFGRGRRERVIAEQFVRVIKVAQQQAILTPEILGLGITAKGYRFYQYEILLASKSAQWKPLRDDALSNLNAFKNVFNPNVKSIAAFDLKNKADANPHILFLPSGFVTPFVLELKGSAHTFVITVKNNGVATMEML